MTPGSETAVRDSAGGSVGTGESVPSPDAGRRRARRRWVVVTAVAVAVVAGAVGATTMSSGDERGADDDATAAPLPTGTVERRDLAVTEELDGGLGYGEPVTLAAGRAGVVTSLPRAGAVIRPGEELYSIDLEPSVLLAGKVPAYRALDTAASRGPDVRQLERALVDLDIDADLDVDREFDSATADAVEAWEDDLGRDDPDGEVELGDVVFGPGTLHVAEPQVDVGTQVQPGTPVLTYTGDTKVVTVDLETTRTELMPLDAEVVVTLPDGVETPGTVTSVGTEAEADPADPGATPTVPVEVTLDRQADAEAFDTAEVTVTVEQSRDEGVLAVPVTALLALAEGGYAVQVPAAGDPDGYRLVPVEVGAFTDEHVAVSGDGIEEGLEVVVPE